MSKSYTFHSDAGHGWLAVSLMELIQLGLANTISQYSYKNNSTVYLEEDCDAPKFLNAKKNKGEEIRAQDIQEVYQETSVIRSYSPYYA